MSAFKNDTQQNSFLDDVAKHDDPRTKAKDQVRAYEEFRTKFDKIPFTLKPDVFDLCVDLTIIGLPAVKACAWLWDCQEIKKQGNGGIVFVFRSLWMAGQLFFHLGPWLIRHFGTNSMATSVNGKAIKYYGPPETPDEERKISPETRRILDRLKGIQHGDPGAEA